MQTFERTTDLTWHKSKSLCKRDQCNKVLHTTDPSIHFCKWNTNGISSFQIWNISYSQRKFWTHKISVNIQMGKVHLRQARQPKILAFHKYLDSRTIYVNFTNDHGFAQFHTPQISTSVISKRSRMKAKAQHPLKILNFFH